jgi:non-ribosomal peptide synthetase component F
LLTTPLKQSLGSLQSLLGLKPSCPIPLNPFPCNGFTRLTLAAGQQAKRVPEPLAVADKTESLTYAQLDEKSNSYANYSSSHID